MTATARTHPPGSFWPTEQQEGLLIAALGELDDAIASWQALQPGFVLDELEPGSFDLMAMIYRRFTAGGYDDDVVERLKGIYRREWVRANVFVERTRHVATVLREAGVRALFVEGAAVAERFYPERGVRPSWFVDVLVEPGDATAALDALGAAGWSPSPAPGAASQERRALLDGDRNVCVLRTSPGYDFLGRGKGSVPNEPLWEAAEPYDLDGVELLVPAATDTLLAVCVTGARAQPSGSRLWIVDAVMILRTAEVDWDRLVATGVARGQALRLRDAFRYLSTLPQAPVPPDALARLDAVRTTRRERLEHALSSGAITAGGSIPELAARHLAATRERSSAGALGSFPGRLGAEWGLTSGRQLPTAVARRVVRAIRGRRAS